MNRALVPALVACAVLSLGMNVQDCYEPPPPTCEAITLTVDGLGRSTVMNYNPGGITFDLEISASTCTSCQSTTYGSFEGETLPPNSLGMYTADEPSDICLDVYCCDIGAIYHAYATLTLHGAGCQVSAEAHSESCTTQP